MQSSDRDRFFETDASAAQRQRKAAKASNRNGSPITMKSKILAAIPNPKSPLSSIFIAESAGFVRIVNLESQEPTQTYRGPKAPVTCLTLGGQDNSILFAGCWDKDVWSWEVTSAQPRRKYTGHSDFVKTVLTTRISGTDILISGGADKKIIVWDIDTGKKIHVLQDASTTMMAVQHIVVDPVLSGKDEIVVVSASSDPHIRRWKIKLDGWEQLPESYVDKPDERLTIAEHDTTVYKLWFDTDSEDAECDLWTASADGTVKCLQRVRNFVTDDTFEHGDYVKAVAVTELWVITAGRNEDVKIWDRTSGKLYATLEGHFEEVADLVLLRDAYGKPKSVCSVSIDRTIRTWPLGKLELDQALEEMKKAAQPKVEEGPEKDKAAEDGLLTAEEEAELAELMGDGD